MMKNRGAHMWGTPLSYPQMRVGEERREIVEVGHAGLGNWGILREGMIQGLSCLPEP